MKNSFVELKMIIRKIADIPIRIILFVFYFVVITPLGIFARLFKDYLKIKSDGSWQDHKEISDIQGFLKRQ